MAVEANIAGWRTNRKAAHIHFQNQEVNIADVKNSNIFPGPQSAEELHLYISTDNVPRSVCDVQDALFTFLNHLGPTHKLRTLNIRIDVSMPEDNYAGYEIFTSNYAERMFNQDIMREFRGISPGEISRPHITALLTDPLRIIRGAPKGRKGKVNLKYTGETGNPWKGIKTAVRELVQSEGPVADYQLFGEFFKHLRPLLAATEWLVGSNHSNTLKRLHKLASDFASHRIRGRVSDFHSAHHALQQFCEEVVAKKLDFSTASHCSSLEVREW